MPRTGRLSNGWAGEETKGDRELCTAAVTQDGLALELVSEEMKGDRDVCMAAVAQGWQAFRFCSPEMQSRKELLLEMLSQVNMYKFTSEEMQSSETIMLAAIRQEPGERGAYSFFKNAALAKTTTIRDAL